jgi:hypothetical protein
MNQPSDRLRNAEGGDFVMLPPASSASPCVWVEPLVSSFRVRLSLLQAMNELE